MARTINQWRTEVEEELERQGVRNITWTFTGGTHQRAAGTITVKGGREVAITLTCSASPSDHRAIYHVRKDIRRAVNAARAFEEAS